MFRNFFTLMGRKHVCRVCQGQWFVASVCCPAQNRVSQTMCPYGEDVPCKLEQDLASKGSDPSTMTNQITDFCLEDVYISVVRLDRAASYLPQRTHLVGGQPQHNALVPKESGGCPAHVVCRHVCARYILQMHIPLATYTAVRSGHTGGQQFNKLCSLWNDDTLFPKLFTTAYSLCSVCSLCSL